MEMIWMVMFAEGKHGKAPNYSAGYNCSLSAAPATRYQMLKWLPFDNSQISHIIQIPDTRHQIPDAHQQTSKYYKSKGPRRPLDFVLHALSVKQQQQKKDCLGAILIVGCHLRSSCKANIKSNCFSPLGFSPLGAELDYSTLGVSPLGQMQDRVFTFGPCLMLHLKTTSAWVPCVKTKY